MSREARRQLVQELRGSTFEPRETIEETREAFVEVIGPGYVPEGVTVAADALAGRRTLRVQQADGSDNGTLLYFHGGSFVLGSPETAITTVAGLVARTGMVAYSLDYRLAPEHPFPAGIEDCVAAYGELLDRGVDPASVALAGDSAGGGLTITSSLAARDAGLPVAAAIVAFAPGLDATRNGRSMTTRAADDPILDPSSITETGLMYTAGHDLEDPLLSPVLTADLRGLPPILAQVGTYDILLSDSLRLATRAAEADVDVVLDVLAEGTHVYQLHAGRLPEADEALDRAALFLRQRVAAGRPGGE